MNIVLVVTDTRGKNLVFTMDTLKAYSADEATKLVAKSKLQGVHIVHTGAGSYLRANPNVLEGDNLDILSVSSHKLFAALDNLNVVLPLPGFKLYWKLYQAYLKSHEQEGEHVILIDDRPQVTMETARGLIKQGYYNPNPRDEKLSKEHIDKTSRSYLYTYVVQPKHCIFFAAAKIRSLVDEWQSKVDLTKMPEIIATLYHLPYVKPNANPESNDRGLQIAKEFYPLAKKILGAA